MSVVVAIDGPSGSGKSSVAKAVAATQGLAYLDTGAMYRAATVAALRARIDFSDERAVADLVAAMPLVVGLDPAAPLFELDGHDISHEIRTTEISETVSKLATNLEARAILVARQQAIVDAERQDSGWSHGAGIVAEGRDITTVVAPEADVRILLTASPEARLRRRSLDVHGSADAQAMDSTRDQVFRRDADDSTVVDFMHAAPGVTAIDSSDLSFEQTVEAVSALVRAAEKIGAEQSASDGSMDDERAKALRAGLDDYELSEEDLALFEGGVGVLAMPTKHIDGVIAVVGRPNVGKSSLVNRFIGRREAVVQDVPGVTRDRVFYDTQWAGKDLRFVDTGGWETDVLGLDATVANQAEIAVDEADAVIFVVDAVVGVTATDERIVRLLRRSGKPVVLAANKVDNERGEADAALLWGLGLGEPHPVSALHGRGTGDLLDEVLKALPSESAHGVPADDGIRRVALIGRPNVGKSSLLNRLAGADRVVVDDAAGTTRDPVDEIIELEGRPWRFVDTAGIRRHVNQTKGADFYASLRTQAALERAEVAVVLIDTTQALSEQDVRVIQLAVEAGRALVLAYNKWDLMDEDRRDLLERAIEQDLAHVAWAPRVNLSALSGRRVDRLVPALDEALASWDMRIPTGRLNAFLGELVAAHPHPLRGGKQPRILFATQASARPPRFVIFATGFIDPGYRRYIERRLRETFGFEGTPIQISVRVREKRAPRPRK